MRAIRAGLLGIGTVGGGTWDVLNRNAGEIRRRAGRAIRIARVADKDLKKARRLVDGRAALHRNAWEVVRAPDIDIVIELIGGTGIARDLVLEAIAHGKHVVTANKALLARHGNRIFKAAQKKGVMVAFEASVGGGIPIIKALREGLAANRIEWIAGIINGTSNFILSEMRDKGLPFAQVLAEAQARGYAEADPTFDIEGVDAAHKLTILSALAFGIPMQFGKAYTEGISKLTQADIGYAEELGYRIKLLGITRRAPRGIELRVHPTLVPARRLIANVEGVMNAILVKGDAVGATLYYGAGAGSQPTASAVVADLLDVTRLHMKPWRFFGVSLATRVLTAVAGVVAVVVLGWRLDGLLVLQTLVAVAAVPIAAAVVRRDLTPRVDPAVARMLPVFLWRARNRLDVAKLAAEAKSNRRASALGYFLELTAKLGRVAGWKRTIASLRTEAAKEPTRYFFEKTADNPFEAMVAEARTPADARAWGLITGTPTDSFESYFRKVARL